MIQEREKKNPKTSFTKNEKHLFFFLMAAQWIEQLLSQRESIFLKIIFCRQLNGVNSKRILSYGDAELEKN